MRPRKVTSLQHPWAWALVALLSVGVGFSAGDLLAIDGGGCPYEAQCLAQLAQAGDCANSQPRVYSHCQITQWTQAKKKVTCYYYCGSGESPPDPEGEDFDPDDFETEEIEVDNPGGGSGPD